MVEVSETTDLQERLTRLVTKVFGKPLVERPAPRPRPASPFDELTDEQGENMTDEEAQAYLDRDDVKARVAEMDELVKDAPAMVAACFAERDAESPRSRPSGARSSPS